MYTKRFNVQSVIKWTTQGMTESFLDSISYRKYTEANNCVVHGVLAKNRLFLKNVRGTFQKKSSSCTRKCYKFSICVAVPPSRLLNFTEVKFGWKFCEL